MSREFKIARNKLGIIGPRTKNGEEEISLNVRADKTAGKLKTRNCVGNRKKLRALDKKSEKARN